MNFTLEADHVPNGFVISASQTRDGIFGKRINPVALGSLPEFPGDPYSRVALRRLQENGGARMEGANLLIEDEAAADLDAHEARGIGLPDPVPYPMEIRSRDTVASDSFRIWTCFVSRDGQVVSARIEGAAIRLGSKLYRLPRSLLDVHRSVERADRADGKDERLVAMAEIGAALPGDGSVTPDAFLSGIRIYHAHTFSLDVETQDGGLDFVPVPLGAWLDVTPEHEPTIGAEEILPAPLLSERQQARYAEQFRRHGSTDAHVLGDGSYLLIDPALRPAVELVATKRGSTMEERTAFALQPERVLQEQLGRNAYAPGGPEDEPRLRFVATGAYSERVTEIGSWVPPDLPFIKNAASNWLPERFSILLGASLVTLAPDEVEGALARVRETNEAGGGTVLIGGVEVSVTPEVVTILEGMERVVRPPDTPIEDEVRPDLIEEREVADGPFVLRTKTNHQVREFERSLSPRPLVPSPPDMRSTLRPHQVAAHEWLVATWKQGRPGVLLADDMGLGKTIEVLSFLSALRQGGETRPFLVVAPTSLLDNWSREHDDHLSSGLGEQITAYGAGLRNLRTGTGREDVVGAAVLDTQTMTHAGWVLTTYETLRDYQFTFAQIDFAVAVYDETQKVKNPKSRMTAAAKSVSADFSIAMTGTPVENHMADLWSIADLVSPGLLPDLRSFVNEHTAEDLGNLRVLRDSLLEPRKEGTAPFALRRMKDDVVDLPALKAYHPRRDMEGQQAHAYQSVVMRAQAGSGRDRLRVLHDMRSISLHPTDPHTDPFPGDAAYIAASARMRPTFEILDRVSQHGTKVIIFLQSRKVQDVLADLISRRFQGTNPLIVRGDTPASQRQAFVDRFSQASGFEVIILSPRAAGVGLNVTAATCVIHLDRWWNPAVEDQCTARAYRIGQTREVEVHYPIAIHPGAGDGSYDAVLDGVLERKRHLSGSLFVPADLTTDDFAALSAIDDIDRSAPNSEALLRLIDERGSSYLEDFVRRHLQGAGMDAIATPRSGDGGADVVVRKGRDIQYIIQCKHTSKPARNVGASTGIMGDLERATRNWDAPNARFVAVTNANGFSNDVVQACEEAGAIVIGRAALAHLDQVFTKEIDQL